MSKPHPAHLAPGLEATCERVVSAEMTLAHLNPKWPSVFSTPAMIGMMELACSSAVKDALPPGCITVGVRIEVDHVKALPAGATVLASSKLAEIHGRRLIFEVVARSGGEVLGRGRVFQAVVDRSRFESGAAKHPSR